MNAALQSSLPMPTGTPASACTRVAPRRYLALWLPYLSTDLLKRHGAGQDDRPLVLVEKRRGAMRLCAMDATAAQAGLRNGMALADARSIVPALATADFAPDKDREALLHCADAAMRLTPLVSLDGADGLVLDITGCAHLFGGENGLRKTARRLMMRFGLTVQTAISVTPQAAHAFARFAQEGIVPSGDEIALARRLSIQALEADADTERALARAGFRTLGDLADRPAHGLTARFGAELTTRLQCIFGFEDRRITPLRQPPDIMAERHFPEPLALLDSLLRVFDRLADHIVGRLEKREEGGRAFEASFFRSDGAVRCIRIETAQGTRDAGILAQLLRLKIDCLADSLDPGFGFDAVRLAVLRSEPLHKRQDDLVEATSNEDESRAIAGLVDRLVARFGQSNVRRLIASDTHDPARSAASVRFDAPMTAVALPPLEAGEPPARPLTLFERPQPIEATAEVPDGPPVQFRWRRVLHEVTRAEGPERIAPEWWRPEDTFPAIRDYYRVEDAEGHRFWLFREGFYQPEAYPRWYVHGLFA